MMGPDESIPIHLPIPEVPRCLQIRSVTKGLIKLSDSQEYSHFRTAAHVFLWAPWEGSSIFGQFRAAVMMQLRFDGTFGFPGGLINKQENILDGLNRELVEEIGWDPTKQKVTWDHYYNTRVDQDKKAVFHFFTVQMTLDQFKELEGKGHSAQDYGSEVFGSVRVPLYTMSNNFGGFPAFLNHRFVEVAKQQLLLALLHTKIFEEIELEEVMHKSQNMKLAPSRF